jgi:hypothetical protein
MREGTAFMQRRGVLAKKEEEVVVIILKCARWGGGKEGKLKRDEW